MLSTLQRKTHNPKRYTNRTFNLGMLLLALMVMGTCALAIDRMTNLSLTTTQRSLNAHARTFAIYIRTEEGKADFIDLQADATVGDVYVAASQLDRLSGAQFSLHYRGETLDDREAIVADLGICAESAVDVILINDLQILDQMILPGHSQQVWKRRTYESGHLLQLESYEEFAQYAATKKGDVMEVAAADDDCYFDGEIENKKFNVTVLGKKCMYIFSKVTDIDQWTWNTLRASMSAHE